MYYQVTAWYHKSELQKNKCLIDNSQAMPLDSIMNSLVPIEIGLLQCCSKMYKQVRQIDFQFIFKNPSKSLLSLIFSTFSKLATEKSFPCTPYLLHESKFEFRHEIIAVG